MSTPLPRCSRHVPATQAGVVLLLCLLFLTALTLLGLSASAETVMQDTLANNLQETQRARQSALAAQDWAEHWLLGLGGVAPPSCVKPCAGLLIHGAGSLPAHPETKGLAWWLANGREAGIDPLSGERLVTFTDTSEPPLWLIEQVHNITASEASATQDQAWYRIITRGSGQTRPGIAVVESIVTRPWAESGETATEAGACPGLDPTAPCRRVAWRVLR